MLDQASCFLFDSIGQVARGETATGRRQVQTYEAIPILRDWVVWGHGPANLSADTDATILSIRPRGLVRPASAPTQIQTTIPLLMLRPSVDQPTTYR